MCPCLSDGEAEEATDDEGWMYSFNFVHASWKNHPVRAFTWVRRREWVAVGGDPTTTQPAMTSAAAGSIDSAKSIVIEIMQARRVGPLSLSGAGGGLGDAREEDSPGYLRARATLGSDQLETPVQQSTIDPAFGGAGCRRAFPLTDRMKRKPWQPEAAEDHGPVRRVAVGTCGGGGGNQSIVHAAFEAEDGFVRQCGWPEQRNQKVVEWVLQPGEAVVMVRGKYKQIRQAEQPQLQTAQPHHRCTLASDSGYVCAGAPVAVGNPTAG